MPSSKARPTRWAIRSRVADAYLFVITNWARLVGIDIASLKNLGAFMERMRARPAVQAAMKAEGLLK